MGHTRIQSIDTILKKTFEGVGFEFHDLDGLHWTREQLKEAAPNSDCHRQPVASLKTRGLPTTSSHGTDPKRSHKVAVPVSEGTSTRSQRSRQNSGLDEAARQVACRYVTNTSVRSTTPSQSLPDKTRPPTKTVPRSLRRSATLTHLDLNHRDRSITKADTRAGRGADAWYRAHHEEGDLDSSDNKTSGSGSILSRRSTFPSAFSSQSSGAISNEDALARAIAGGDLDGLVIRDIDDELSLLPERPVTPAPGQESPLKDRGKKKLQSLTDEDRVDEDEDDPGFVKAQDISYYEDNEEEDNLPTPNPYSYAAASRPTPVDMPQSESEMKGEAFEDDATDGFAFSETPESCISRIRDARGRM